MTPRLLSLRRLLLPALVYAVAACLFTWPLVLHPRALFGAVDPTGDPSLNLWTLGWDLRTLSAHPSWVLTGRVFNANIFHPARQTLAYSDHLLLQATALWPIFAATRDLVLCYNVLLVASLIASALAMHALVLELTNAEGAAYVGGTVFGFAPYHFTHLTHIQLQALYFLPLCFLFLHRVFTRGRRWDSVALGVLVSLEAISSAYYGIIGALGLACAAVPLALLTGRWNDWRLMRRGLLAATVAAVVVLPWVIPYVQVERQVGAGRNMFEAAQASAVLASYVQTPSTNVLYGRTGLLTPGPGQRLSRKEGPEQGLFPGFCALLLAILGVIWAPVPLRKLAIAYVIVGSVGVVLSLGPGGVRFIYFGLYQVLFGMEAIRASARFSVLALFAIAVLAAFGMAALQARGKRLGPLVLAAALLITGLEYLNGAIPFPTRPMLTSGAGRYLAAQPGNGAVICLPMGLDRENTPCMLQSLEHGRPIVNGYSGLRPPFFAAIADTMSRMPSTEAFQALHDLDVEYVVSDQRLVVPAALAGAIQERARFEKQVVYQMTWSPEILAALVVDTGPAPVEPGPPAFQVGESATYEVRWTSGPMNVPAGEMTISVAPPRGREAFRFVGSAKTAPWVARFFEADAQLETTADARLLPIDHVETVSDGKRRIDRQLTFDFGQHHVQMTSGGASVLLPLASAARDPMSALYYVRTLPLTEGAIYSLPLTDNGRPSRLDIVVGPRETIMANGRTWEAWKIEPQLHQRIERQSPLTLTTWVTADSRRLPLLIDVNAGFGSVRAELSSYRDR